MFGAYGKASSAHSIAFVSKAWNLSISISHSHTHTHNYTIHKQEFFVFVCKQAAKDNGVKALYDLNKRVEAVCNVRNLRKCDMKLNDALPKILVDPETYTVTADGDVLTCSAATTVPLSRNYFLF